MRVRVLFFGMLKDLAGKSSDFVNLPAGAVVRDVLGHYAREHRMNHVLGSIAVAVNAAYAGTETLLREDDEVALLPPVSGGSGGDEEAPASSLATERRASITHAAIHSQVVIESIRRDDDGAIVLFEGVVRNQTRGCKTQYLEYEAYEKMALLQMETLAEQAITQFKVRDAALVHRLGRMEIGETSVLIVVASAHRVAAFDACHWLIDTLKRTVPIWKKEYFEDGVVWADGEPFPAEIVHGSSVTTGSPVAERASK